MRTSTADLELEIHQTEDHSLRVVQTRRSKVEDVQLSPEHTERWALDELEKVDMAAREDRSSFVLRFGRMEPMELSIKTARGYLKGIIDEARAAKAGECPSIVQH